MSLRLGSQDLQNLTWMCISQSVQLLSCVQFFATPWTTARQSSLSITNSQSYPNSCPLSQWCHLTMLSFVVFFSSCLQSFPASGSFQMSQFFASGGQNIGVSGSTLILPMNIQDWFPLGWTGWISMQIKIITLFIWIFSPSSILSATEDLALPRYWKCT